MTEALHFPATTWHQPVVIGWFACAMACAVSDGMWVAPARKAQLVRSKLAYNGSGIYAVPLHRYLKFNTNLNRVLHIYLVSKR